MSNIKKSDRVKQAAVTKNEASPLCDVPRSRRLTLPSSVSFWLMAALIVLFIYASTAPTPLYRVYQAKLGFSVATLTAVFAVYVLFLLATLLIFGSLSDHIGRRPVIMWAIGVDVAAFVLFALAHGIGLLCRILGACGYGMYGRALAVTLHLPPTPDRLSSRTTSPSPWSASSSCRTVPSPGPYLASAVRSIRLASQSPSPSATTASSLI